MEKTLQTEATKKLHYNSKGLAKFFYTDFGYFRLTEASKVLAKEYLLSKENVRVYLNTRPDGAVITAEELKANIKPKKYIICSEGRLLRTEAAKRLSDKLKLQEYGVYQYLKAKETGSVVTDEELKAHVRPIKGIKFLTFYYNGEIYPSIAEAVKAGFPKRMEPHLYEQIKLYKPQVVNLNDFENGYGKHKKYPFDEAYLDMQEWYKNHSTDPCRLSKDEKERRLGSKIQQWRLAYKKQLCPELLPGYSGKISEREVKLLNLCDFHWNGQPVLNCFSTSAVFYYLKELFGEENVSFEDRETLLRDNSDLFRCIDFVIPDKKICIEYHDTYHHSGARNERTDILKAAKLASMGYTYIRLRKPEVKALPEIENVYDVAGNSLLKILKGMQRQLLELGAIDEILPVRLSDKKVVAEIESLLAEIKIQKRK